MNELALFAGAGGGILGGHLLGWRTVCAVEFDAYARSVLLARQRDGCLPRFPVWDDVRTFNGKPWRGHVDVVSGGFPCQDISAAGKGAGIDGERSGLWREMARIVGEVRPSFVFVENSPLLVDRGLTVVLGDLAKMGYDARWGIVGAHHAGAPHKRDRCWVLAHSGSDRGQWWRAGRNNEAGTGARDAVEGSGEGPDDVAHAASWESWQQTKRQGREDSGRGGGDCRGVEGSGDAKVSDADGQHGDHAGHGAGAICRERMEKTGLCDVSNPACNRGEAGISEPEPRQEGQPGKPFNGHSRSPGTGSWWQSEPQLGRVADGMAAWLDVHGTHAKIDVGRVATGIPKRSHRLRCIGNGQVPAALVMAWNELTKP